MKTRYNSPVITIIEIASEGVLCSSTGNKYNIPDDSSFSLYDFGAGDEIELL